LFRNFTLNQKAGGRSPAFFIAIAKEVNCCHAIHLSVSHIFLRVAGVCQGHTKGHAGVTQ
jgi:hypothetical protein